MSKSTRTQGCICICTQPHVKLKINYSTVNSTHYMSSGRVHKNIFFKKKKEKKKGKKERRREEEEKKRGIPLLQVETYNIVLRTS